MDLRVDVDLKHAASMLPFMRFRNCVANWLLSVIWWVVPCSPSSIRFVSSRCTVQFFFVSCGFDVASCLSNAYALSPETQLYKLQSSLESYVLMSNAKKTQPVGCFKPCSGENAE